MTIASDNIDFVIIAQSRLRDLKLYGGAVDGRADPATQAALQRALAPILGNGIGTGAGAATQDLDNTDFVTLAQGYLQALGLYGGPIDGHGDIDLQAILQTALGRAPRAAAVTTPPPAATAPAAFTVGQWTLADSPSVGGNTLTLTITALPSDGGSAITALQYTLNGGSSWTALSGTGTGARNITVLASTLASVQIRAVNAVNPGTASDTKTATPTVGGGAIIGASPTTFAIPPDVHYHVHSGTMTKSGGGTPSVGDRVASIVDLRGLADATQATEAFAPILGQDAAGRRCLIHRTNGWMAVADTLTGISARAFTVLIRGRTHRASDMDFFYPRWNATPGTANTLRAGALSSITNGGRHSYLGTGNATATSGAQSDVPNRRHMIPTADEAVFGHSANGTNVFYRMNNKKATSAGATGTASNRIGAIIGAVPTAGGATDTTANNSGFTWYEIAVWKGVLTEAQFDAAANAMMAGLQETGDFVNQIGVEGDSIFTSIVKANPPSTNGNHSDLNIAMRLTEPGARLVPADCRVFNVANGGSRITTGGNSVAARAAVADATWNQTLAGVNIVMLQIGANDAATTTGSAMYAEWLDLCNNATTGFLPRGWKVCCSTNIMNGTSGTTQTNITNLRDLLVSSLITDTDADAGGVYEGKVKVIQTHLVEDGGQTVFESATDSQSLTYYLIDDPSGLADRLHPSATGTGLFVTGGGTPLNGLARVVDLL